MAYKIPTASEIIFDIISDKSVQYLDRTLPKELIQANEIIFRNVAYGVESASEAVSEASLAVANSAITVGKLTLEMLGGSSDFFTAAPNAPETSKDSTAKDAPIAQDIPPQKPASPAATNFQKDFSEQLKFGSWMAKEGNNLDFPAFKEVFSSFKNETCKILALQNWLKKTDNSLNIESLRELSQLTVDEFSKNFLTKLYLRQEPETQYEKLIEVVNSGIFSGRNEVSEIALTYSALKLPITNLPDFCQKLYPEDEASQTRLFDEFILLGKVKGEEGKSLLKQFLENIHESKDALRLVRFANFRPDLRLSEQDLSEAFGKKTKSSIPKSSDDLKPEMSAEKETEAKIKEAEEVERKSKEEAQAKRDSENKKISERVEALERIATLVKKGASDREILGVAPDASKKEIVSAFRKISLLVHPDKNLETPTTSIKPTEAFQIVNAAFSNISR